MNQEHLYDPVGDVIAGAISRELPVRLTDLERLELADRKAAAEDELAAHQNRMAEQRRELAKHGEAIARRTPTWGPRCASARSAAWSFATSVGPTARSRWSAATSTRAIRPRSSIGGPQRWRSRSTPSPG